MTALERVLRWYSSTLRLDRPQRTLMYRALGAQVRQGMSGLRACETLAGDVEISAEVKRVAHCAATAAREGRPLTAGLDESRSIPVADLGVLGVAERNNRLADAFERLADEGEAPLTIVRHVVAPVTHYLAILGVLLFFGTQAQGLLEGIARKEEARAAVTQVPAYRLSEALNAGLVPVAAVLGGYLLVAGGHGRANWTGRARRLLLFFDAESRAHLAIRFAELAESLYAQGASHTEVLDAAAEAYGGGRFAAAAFRTARHDHVVDGIAVERALAGRVLPPALAELVMGMVPEGERRLYPGAYAVVAKIQRAVLERRYGVAASTLRLVVLAALGGLLLTLGHGLYTTMSLLRTVV